MSTDGKNNKEVKCQNCATPTCLNFYKDKVSKLYTLPESLFKNSRFIISWETRAAASYERNKGGSGKVGRERKRNLAFEVTPRQKAETKNHRLIVCQRKTKGRKKRAAAAAAEEKSQWREDKRESGQKGAAAPQVS